MASTLIDMQFCTLFVCLGTTCVIDAKYRLIPNVALVLLGVVRLISLVLIELFALPVVSFSLLRALCSALGILVLLLTFKRVALLLIPTAYIGAGDIKIFTILGLYFGMLPTLALLGLSALIICIYMCFKLCFIKLYNIHSQAEVCLDLSVPMAPFVVVSILILCCYFVL